MPFRKLIYFVARLAAFCENVYTNMAKILKFGGTIFVNNCKHNNLKIILYILFLFNFPRGNYFFGQNFLFVVKISFFSKAKKRKKQRKKSCSTM